MSYNPGGVVWTTPPTPGQHIITTPTVYTGTTTALCPDRLEYRHIGVADNLRGRVVRGFFWAMQLWKVRR